MAAPNKQQREKCWNARDNLWKCLDENEDKMESCLKLNELFEQSCSKQWVKYFIRRRQYLKFQDKVTKEGFEPINENKEKT